MEISASILAANYSDLKPGGLYAEVAEKLGPAGGRIHLDLADDKFAKKQIDKDTFDFVVHDTWGLNGRLIDIHLMMDKYPDYITNSYRGTNVDSGKCISSITFHFESEGIFDFLDNVPRTFTNVGTINPKFNDLKKEIGPTVADILDGYNTINKIDIGIGILPDTNISKFAAFYNEFYPNIDSVLLLCVNPGFSYQEPVVNPIERVKEFKKLLPDFKGSITVDGGVTVEMLKDLENIGVDIAVQGGAIFGK